MRIVPVSTYSRNFFLSIFDVSNCLFSSSRIYHIRIRDIRPILTWFPVTSCQVISNKTPACDCSKVRALHFAFLHHYASQQPPRAIRAKTDTVYVQPRTLFLPGCCSRSAMMLYCALLFVGRVLDGRISGWMTKWLTLCSQSPIWFRTTFSSKEMVKCFEIQWVWLWTLLPLLPAGCVWLPDVYRRVPASLYTPQ